MSTKRQGLTRSPCNVSRSRETMVSVFAVIALLFAGQAAAGEWVPITSFTPRNMPGVAEVDGKIYVVGGGSLEGDPDPVLSSVEIYEIAADAWMGGPDLNTARYALALGVANGKLYAIGGGLHVPRTNAVEEYSPGAGSWIDKTPMTVARQELAVATVNGKIYAMGGDIISAATDSVEEYDPGSDTWTTVCPLPGPWTVRSGADAFADEVYLFGGYDGNPLDSVYRYDPAAGCPWSLISTLPQVHTRHGVAERDGRLILAGGYTAGGVKYATVWSYDATSGEWGSLPDLPITDHNGDLLNVGGTLYYVSSIAGTIYEYQETEPPPPPIPTVSEWGLIVMGFLLTAGIIYCFGRRRVART